MAIIGTPKFEQIKRRLIADIECGTLVPGARIASETELMERHGVARMTVVRSLNELATEGYLVRMKGKGTFVKVRQANGDGQKKLTAFALLLPEVRSGFYPSLIKSFSDASGGLNRQILTCNTSNSVEKQGDSVLQLIDSRVAGVAIVPPTCGTPPDYHVRQLQNHDIPVVLLHRGVAGVTAPLISLNHEEAGRMAGQALVAAGHRNVAFFGTHASIGCNAYLEGLRIALRGVDADLPSELIHYGQVLGEHQCSPEHQAGVEQSLKKMLKLPEASRPTAIFSSWDPDAELVYMTLSKLGIRVPVEVSLMSIGGVWRSSAVARQLTAVTADEEYAGRLAVQLLDEMAAGVRPLDDQFRASVPLGLYEGMSLKQLAP